MHGKAIFSIGHSNRPIEEFVALLTENAITLLVDVRTVPRSRTNPQFNTDALPVSLKKAGIKYLHMASLGGLRGKSKSALASPNTAWENASFRNYADYALTESFQNGLNELIGLAQHDTIAYMCAEAVWWRCHRRIITDYLLARGLNVKHIMAPGKVINAVMNDHAVVREDGFIEYPADQQELDLNM